jgi:hypothetical protein
MTAFRLTLDPDVITLTFDRYKPFVGMNSSGVMQNQP